MPSVCRLGDPSSHGGTIITASLDVHANGIPVARAGDLHACPIRGHGITPLSSSALTQNVPPVVRIGDTAGCGAAMVGGSVQVSAN